MSELFEFHRDDNRRAAAWRSEKVRYLPHYHAAIELVYVLKGEVSAIIGGRSVAARENEALLSGSYMVHSYADDASVIVAIIPPDEFPAIQKQLSGGQFSSPVIPDGDGHLLSLLNLLIDHLEDSVIRAGLAEAIVGLAMKRAGFGSAPDKGGGSVMAKALRYMSENYTQSISAESIALHFGYSRSRFSHLFKSSIGVSIPRYVNILRCRDAAEALLHTDLSVVDIAINAGFNNAHTFYVAFRELYHMTPGEYAKAARREIR